MNPDRAPSKFGSPFRIGDWHVQPDLNRITGAHQTVQIEPRVMEVLVYLASCAGRVVSRKELHDAVWGDTVVCDQTLTRAIWELRQALGDDSAAPRFIETIRKGGYRLIAPVASLGVGASSGTPDEVETRALDRVRVRLRGIPPIVAAAVGIIVVVAGAVTWVRPILQGRHQNSSLLEATPLTSFPGRERFPAISPDGTRVAFSWKGDDGESYDIYVKQVDADSRLRLTDSPEHELYPAWSPDGSNVAFVRFSDQCDIFTVPSIGGEVRRLASAGWGLHGIDWSPDGKWIAYAAYDGPSSPTGIKLLSPETLETHALTASPERSAWYPWPRFSPDGRTVAFLRSGNHVQKDIYVVPTTGGDPRRLTHMICPMAGIDWSADGKQLVLSASHGQDYLLWLVSSDDGTSKALPTQITPASYPSLSRNADRLIYESTSVDRDIWRMSIGEEHDERTHAAPFISSTRMDCCAEYSPDGSRILFLSARSGHKEVWICDSDGRNVRRITSLESYSMGQPRWSPDGRRIAFSAFLGSYSRVFVVDVDGGVAQCMSTAPRHEMVDAWARDGSWVYVHCSSDSGWSAEKWRPDGSEEAPLGIDGGSVVFESREGDLLFHRFGERGILKARPDGTEEEYVADPCDVDGWTDVTFTDGGIYFVAHSREGETLGFFDFSTGQADTLAHLHGSSNNYVSVSPDRTTVLFDRPERDESDVILVPRL